MLTPVCRLLLAVCLLAIAPQPLRGSEYDVVIYGGTPAGIAAAIAAARQGASTVIVEPSRWIGGMVAGGLSATDVGDPATVGGFAREFFTRAAASKPGTPLWFAEPHVNMATFRAMLEEAGVPVVTEQRLERIVKEGPWIRAVISHDGTRYAGRVFVDATYEGDLMAAAGVSYTVGRESREQYNEPLAGFYPVPLRPQSEEVMGSVCRHLGGLGPCYIHGTPAPLPAYDDRGRLLFGVNPYPDLKPGDGDHRVQAYNYRLCVTRRADNRVPFPRPRNYDPQRYELLLRLIERFPNVRFGRLFHLASIAGEKYDLNAQGLFSTDYPGANTDYPEGDHATRERIRQDHKDFIQGIFWFLMHDPRVPERLRAETREWGLCRDEFVDNDHWPYALYVREARRMVGRYVMTQHDVQRNIFKPDSVGMGSFVIDCHIVQRIALPDGTVRDEGSFPDQPVLPYQIPYRALTPRKDECHNLLVPVCLSASHVAYCSIRMEPVYMAMGQASGTAAAMAAKQQITVQDVDVPQLQRTLRSHGAVLELPNLPDILFSDTLPGIVVREETAEKEGEWYRSGFGYPVDGSALHDGNTGKGHKRVIYPLRIPRAGLYEVRWAYVAAPNRASNVPVTVLHARGSHKVIVDQRKKPPVQGHFVRLGTFFFSPGKPAAIVVENHGTDGYVSADVVQLLPPER